MSKDNAEEKPMQTPLEIVKENQAAQQHNKEVQEQNIDSVEEVPGHGAPSEIRKHPQRTQY